MGEAPSLHIDDVQLQRDDERLSVLGKGGRHRTALLDDPILLRLLRRCLRETSDQHGPLCRAERGTTNSPLRYQSVQARFAAYALTAGIVGSLHDLRHAHAQDLVTVASAWRRSATTGTREHHTTLRPAMGAVRRRGRRRNSALATRTAQAPLGAVPQLVRSGMRGHPVRHAIENVWGLAGREVLGLRARVQGRRVHEERSLHRVLGVVVQGRLPDAQSASLALPRSGSSSTRGRS